MFDWIPISVYSQIYYYVCLVYVLFVYIHLNVSPKSSKKNIPTVEYWGIVFLIFVIFYMGLRPVHKVFADMPGYAYHFERIQAGFEDSEFRDPFYPIFVSFFSKFVEVRTFFLLCAFLYIFPLFVVSKKWFGDYWFHAFLLLAVSFSFWAYGVNGIRNGIAGSLFLLAMSREKRLWQLFWITLAICFHKTMLLPTIGFLLTQIYNKPRQFVFFWTLCIVLSLLGGGFWEQLFANLGFDDNRISYFLTEADSNKFSRTGFRWDFLLYSAAAVYVGWYYIERKNYHDKIYFWLFNTYVFSNAFWILVIRASFSNRFAYLSWFMMALVIVYPLLKGQIMKNQKKVLGSMIMIYFMFTFLLDLILK